MFILFYADKNYRKGGLKDILKMSENIEEINFFLNSSQQIIYDKDIVHILNTKTLEYHRVIIIEYDNYGFGTSFEISEPFKLKEQDDTI